MRRNHFDMSRGRIVIPSGISYYTITASAGEHGSISPLGETVVRRGGSAVFTFNPDANYYVNGILLDGVLSAWDESEYTLSNVKDDHTVEVRFAYGIPGYTITVNQPDNGVINYSIDGDLIIFTVSPNEGYHIGDVTVNSESVGAVESYTIDTTVDPAGGYTISAAMTQADVNTVSLLHFDIDENSIQQLGTATVDVPGWYDERWTTLQFANGTAVPDPIPLNTSGLRIRFTSGALSGQTFDITSVYQGFVDPEYPEYSEPDTVTVSGDASAAVNGDTFVVEQISIVDEVSGNIWVGSRLTPNGKFGASLCGTATFADTGLQLGSGDWTVEGWVYNSATLHQRVKDLGYTYLWWHMTADTTRLAFDVQHPESKFYISTAIGVPANTWTHVAFVRLAGFLLVFMAGQSLELKDGNTYRPYSISIDTPLVVSTGDYLDEWRFSNIARYTENFTPPSGPYGV